MLFGLYFTTCLVSNPAHCVTRKHVFDDAVSTPQQCLTVAQPVMARWSVEHQDRWRIERYRCGAPPRDDGTRI